MHLFNRATRRRNMNLQPSGGEPQAPSLAGDCRVCCPGLRVPMEEAGCGQHPASWLPGWFLRGVHRPPCGSEPPVPLSSRSRPLQGNEERVRKALSSATPGGCQRPGPRRENYSSPLCLEGLRPRPSRGTEPERTRVTGTGPQPRCRHPKGRLETGRALGHPPAL